MKVKIYGSRGSVPIANRASVEFGGNTTCIRVVSECLPPGTALVLDAGTGYVPLSHDLLREGELSEVVVLLAHSHHDHTQGLFLSPLTFTKKVKVRLSGPVQLGVDPKQMLESMMRPPHFPVHYKRVESHFVTKGFEDLLAAERRGSPSSRGFPARVVVLQALKDRVPGDLNLSITVSVTRIRLIGTETLPVGSTRRMATVRVAREVPLGKSTHPEVL